MQFQAHNSLYRLSQSSTRKCLKWCTCQWFIDSYHSFDGHPAIVSLSRAQTLWSTKFKSLLLSWISDTQTRDYWGWGSNWSQAIILFQSLLGVSLKLSQHILSSFQASCFDPVLWQNGKGEKKELPLEISSWILNLTLKLSSRFRRTFNHVQTILKI